MIRKVINVNDYWKVIVYYDLDYNLFDYVADSLNDLGLNENKIDDIYYNLYYNAKAVTISSTQDRTSVVIFNKHNNKYDYINSIVHEAEYNRFFGDENDASRNIFLLIFINKNNLEIRVIPRIFASKASKSDDDNDN